MDNPLLQYCLERNISTSVLSWYNEAFYMSKGGGITPDLAKSKDAEFLEVRKMTYEWSL